jgi:uncharacterized cupredoxin-like copper-binding protein/Cu/Ag efflux protein CusF
MKTAYMTAATLLLSASLAAASPGHSGGHHDMAVGEPGDEAKVTRTIDVTMFENDDGEMLFQPNTLEVEQGQTIRFNIVNDGEIEHEFVLDEKEKNVEHRELMMRFPEMEHDDPNAIQLDAGERGSIVWTFTNAGTFEFACLIPGHYESGMHGAIEVSAAPTVAPAVIAQEYTRGTVKEVKADREQVTVIHEELKNLDMPAMTMVFNVADPAMLDNMKEGDAIEFVADRVRGRLTITDVK